MISFDNVTYSYPSSETPALRDISFEVKFGESICIMGANGSGKSTLARLLASLIKPYRGTVRVDGNSKLPVGILFQNPDNQMIAVTVEKELAFALENLAVAPDEIDRRITETLESFSISHLRKRLTAELSGGEKQRVALSSLMIYEPSVLILDEPDSFLDAEGRRILSSELEHIKTRNPEMIQIRITQYPHVAASYSRLLVLAGGELVADSDPESILSDDDFCQRRSLSFSQSHNNLLNMPHMRINQKQSVNSIKVSSIEFGYSDERRIFNDLSFSLKRFEIVGVVGQTGSGKSTLGQMLVGLLKPDSGEITYLDGENKVLPHGCERGRVVSLFQQPERQFFLTTCNKEIEFGLKNLGVKCSENEIGEMLNFVGLEKESFLDRDPLSLSMGEKRRLAFAVILALNPDFVIFDEPTCGLDPAGVGRFIEIIRSLKKEGKGIIIISHDGDLLKTLSDKILSIASEQPSLESADSFFSRNSSANLLNFSNF